MKLQRQFKYNFSDFALQNVSKAIRSALKPTKNARNHYLSANIEVSLCLIIIGLLSVDRCTKASNFVSRIRKGKNGQQLFFCVFIPNPSQVKLINFLFCLNLLKEGYHIDGIISDFSFCLYILLTEYIGLWYTIFFICHDI